MTTFDKAEELFRQASGPGDIATILIAGTAGFLADAGLNAVRFLSPGYVAVSAASMALGVKKGIDARITRKRAEEEASRKKLEESRAARDKEMDEHLAAQRALAAEQERASKLQKLFEVSDRGDLARAAERERLLLELGATDAASSRLVLDELIKEYRSSATSAKS